MKLTERLIEQVGPLGLLIGALVIVYHVSNWIIA